MTLVQRLWTGRGPEARIARAALQPAAWGYHGLMRARNALYDRGLLRSHDPALATLSLGNLSVGGTGKTPMAAWVAARLKAGGAHPAIVLRGYGGDEALVHARLNPDVGVVADADRVRGVRRARELGADCVVLDDAFQHRRIRRTADWVLVAAEEWQPDLRTLPAGPWREGPAALGRADLLVVTRKSATRDRAESVGAALAPALRNPDAVAICHLAPFAVVDALGGNREPLSWLDGRTLTAVAAVGAPDAFFAQLIGHGAAPDTLRYPDHHAFDAHDVARIARAATRHGAVVCTLKDAVKLAPLWPRAGPTLWYVSQRAVIERGGAALDASLAVVLAARSAAPSTAGPAGPSSPAHGHRPSTADR